MHLISQYRRRESRLKREIACFADNFKRMKNKIVEAGTSVDFHFSVGSSVCNDNTCGDSAYH